MDNFEKLKYSVGALLYVPALNADSLSKRPPSPACSLAFCFEDSILEASLAEAETKFLAALNQSAALKNLPKLFIRPRNPEHMRHLYELIRGHETLLRGFVLPKYDLSNAGAYEYAITKINASREGLEPLFVMPTLESKSIMFKETRLAELIALKKSLDSINKWVLNIRVGGNDFCGLLGLRRNVRQTIYDIAVVKDVLCDILNIFARNYVVSGPVWEYFEGGADSGLWREGLERELQLDRLNGFIGKTAIHPSQIPIINAAMKVSRSDYEDALELVNWHNKLAVSKSPSTERRMNEVQVQTKWARKTLLLADIWGVL